VDLPDPVSAFIIITLSPGDFAFYVTIFRMNYSV